MNENPVTSEDNKSGHMTAGVRTLMGDPKKAILKLGLPMILAMSVQTVYNLVDTFWVSGLGADSLAAIGFVFPFFMVMIALSTGLGVGAGSAISRKLGARDKAGADYVAVHSMVIMLVLSVLFTVPMLIFSKQIFMTVGAGKTTELAMDYGNIIFAGSFVLFFTNVAGAILRSEGNAKGAMNAMILGAVLNIILDPIFIYPLGMGMKGAAWATVLSMAITAVIMAKWLFLDNTTYVSFNFRDFIPNWDIIKDIFRVGLPATMQQVTMAMTMLIMNLVIIAVDNTDGVAVYTVGWRVVMIAIAPLIGMGTAVVTVSGFAYGEHSYEKLLDINSYSIKVGTAIEVVIAVLTFVFAPQIALAFTQAESAAHIMSDITTFLKIVCIFYPTTAMGLLSSSLFQGVGKGINSLITTIIRSLIFTPLFAFVFAFYLKMGLTGVWWGLLFGNVLGGLITYAWVYFYVRSLQKGSQKGVQVSR
ncbi:MATE family efflux transporter [uncultured Methanomethylovorans sp.]|uniref:MATE family efflux transporter n=1 Tax=uncultured Methanomethylovorans sp. TaxID=183759 RepID=UPI002AA76802|nr:MATE family efflux transporter [uncultured Methanomethylovorans sp.]